MHQSDSLMVRKKGHWDLLGYIKSHSCLMITLVFSSQVELSVELLQVQPLLHSSRMTTHARVVVLP